MLVNNGEPIFEGAIEVSVQEVENAHTHLRLLTTRRGRGRARLGGDKKGVESVRLGPTLKSEAQQRAPAEGISMLEVVRRALAQYLHSP